MLIHDFVYIDSPARSVAELVLPGSAWLGQAAAGAYQDGQNLLLRAGPGESSPVRKRVRISVGSARNRQDAVVVPIHWEATGVTGLFPVLDAELEFCPVGPEATQLSLWGTYDPPLDGFGIRLDHMIFHRVAEATVRSFLRKLADGLQAAVQAPGQSDPPVGSAA